MISGQFVSSNLLPDYMQYFIPHTTNSTSQLEWLFLHFGTVAVLSTEHFLGHFRSSLTQVIFAVILQTDVQKILRNARKLPDKTQTFYKVNVAESSSEL